MKISNDGLAIVKAFEGCLRPVGNGRFAAYLDPIGVLTIGWGHTNHHGRHFDVQSVWTATECDQALAEDMSGFEAAVGRLVKVKLNQTQFDALVSFTYNCGEGNLGKSTLLKKVNASDFSGAANEFAKWNKAGGKVFAGLTRRRKAESTLFQGRVSEAYSIAGTTRANGQMVQQVDLPVTPAAPAARSVAAGTLVAGGATAATVATKKGHDWGAVAGIMVLALLVGVLVWRFWPKSRG